MIDEEIVFLRTELDERSSIIQDIYKFPHFQNTYLNAISAVTCVTTKL